MRSAPCVIGVWNSGPSIVLSTITGGRLPSASVRLSAIRARLGDVDEAIRRIGRRLEVKRGDRPRRTRPIDGLLHRRDPAFRREANRRHAELRQDPRQQEIRAAVDRIRMDDRRAWSNIGPEGGRDRRHPRGEHEIGVGLVPDRQPVFEHFKIGVVDPAVDQAGLFIRPLLAQAVGELEELLAVLRLAEDESRGVKHRRLQRSLGKKRIVAVAHHQGFRRQGSIADQPLPPSFFDHVHFLPKPSHFAAARSSETYSVTPATSWRRGRSQSDQNETSVGPIGGLRKSVGLGHFGGQRSRRCEDCRREGGLPCWG